MAIHLGEFLLVPGHDVEKLDGYGALRRFLESEMGTDLTGIESKLKELALAGEVFAVRLQPHRSRRMVTTAPVDRGIPLRELAGPWLPSVAPLIPVSQEAPVPEAWFEVVLLTDDGVPLSNVNLKVFDDWGFETTGVTDGEGKLRVPTPSEARHKIEVLDLPIKLPAPPAEPKEVKGFSLSRDQTSPLEFADNKTHTLVVTRPRATVVSVDGWWENQKVMIFQSARDTDKGPVTVRGILRQALCSPKGGEIRVVGHADTNGAASDNDALANIRAQSVYLYLSGKRQEWAEHAFANADVATLQAALFWVSLNSLVECDPGPVNGDWGPATSFGLMMLRMEAGISLHAPLGLDDWAAIYDRFDEGLAMLLLTDQAGLAAARARVQAVDPVSKGERFPVDAPTLDGHDCPANRRVDIVFCNPGAIPARDEVYDGTFTLDYLVVAPECRVQIFAINPKMEPIPFARVLVQVGMLGQRWLTTNVGAFIEFTALRSDRMRILRGTEPGGSGNMINNGLQEALLVAQQALGELE